MALRHRAIARLQRHVPSVRAATDRPLAKRLDAREVPERPLPPMPGEGLKMPVERGVRNLRPVTLGDPSPLLIRLVRHPYAQRTVSPGRRPDTERPTVQERPRPETNDIRALLDDVRPQFSSKRERRAVIAAAPKPFRRFRAAAIPDADTLPVELG